MYFFFGWLEMTSPANAQVFIQLAPVNDPRCAYFQRIVQSFSAVSGCNLTGLSLFFKVTKSNK
jgi:tellurite resistance protein TehA-like permease